MRQFLGRIKGWLREQIDSLYCINLPSKECIGSSDSWWIDTSRIRNAIVYSGGVGKDITFEMELAKRFDAKIYLFDPSPTGLKTIMNTHLPSSILFFPVGLDNSDGLVNFAAPNNPQEGSFRISEEADIQFPCRSLHSLFKENEHQEVELLKIDIEGFEYGVINDLIESQLEIRQIAVEFHDFYSGISKSMTQTAIKRLQKAGYQIIHKRGHDYTFLKRSVGG